jgi:H/ACA ribonucleoprotein complex subunit 2
MSDDGEGKGKGGRRSSAGGLDEKTYEECLLACSPIAKPMASRKQVKKLHKLVKKGSAAKCARRGVKEVVKGLRKGAKGLCVIAGDISPIDVITHLPTYCEENGVPYMYVPSKQGLGAAASTKRPTSCVLVTPGKGFDAQELFDELTGVCKEAEVEIPRA